MKDIEQEIRQKVLDEFIATLNVEIENSKKFLLECDDSLPQKAYHSGLNMGLKIAKDMKEGKVVPTNNYSDTLKDDDYRKHIF